MGYAPRRNPEIVVAAVVEDTSEHGGTVAGPVVRDIVKMYYDKKQKKGQTQTTVEYQRYNIDSETGKAELAENEKGAAKPAQAVAKVEAVAAKKAQP